MVMLFIVGKQSDVRHFSARKYPAVQPPPRRCHAMSLLLCIAFKDTRLDLDHPRIANAGQSFLAVKAGV
jgi:hypothetical protein